MFPFLHFSSHPSFLDSYFYDVTHDTFRISDRWTNEHKNSAIVKIKKNINVNMYVYITFNLNYAYIIRCIQSNQLKSILKIYFFHRDLKG